MKDRFSEEDVVTTVVRLTHSQLVGFIEAEFVKPQHGAGGYVFRRIDIARLELLCDLAQDLDLSETAIGIITSLLDQLHAARLDLATMARTIDALPADLQANITKAMKQL